ncbi:MAG: amidohydrolase [Spirochaetaceae bacterium]|nr:MAG: amidohydrolase [Spirochaetaceae bacterium]
MMRPSVDPADLKTRIRKILPEITEIRRGLHRIPETKLEERETSKKIRELIAGTKIELLDPYIGTDVVGLLRGAKGNRGKTASSGRRKSVNVTLRSDIDALPIEEKSGKSWKSEHSGRAHSCGHDGHMAILIGTLKVLDSLTDRFEGSVRFVFQPAEEEAGGGKMMVDRGLLDADPKPSAVFALHGWPGIPSGTIAAIPGPAMAAQDRFRITVKGRGGHGAVPNRTIDPIVTGAQIVSGLQTIVSRSLEPVAAGVVSVCTIHGGTTSNVIPDEVVMEGTTRYFDKKVQTLIRSRMEELIRGICQAAGATHSFEYSEGYIPLVNDPEKVEFLTEIVESYLGQKAWIPDLPQVMGAEDFAFYLAKVPGVFLRLGLGEDSPSLHSAEFDFNDQAIEAGITVMSALALETLNQAAG